MSYIAAAAIVGGAGVASSALSNQGGSSGGFVSIPSTPTQTAATKQLGYLSGLGGFSLLDKKSQKKIQDAEANLNAYLLKISQLEDKHTSGKISDKSYAKTLASYQAKQAVSQNVLDTYQPQITSLEQKQATQTAAGVPNIPSQPVVGMTDTEKAAQDQLTKYATTPFELSGLEQTGQTLASQYANSAQRTIPTLQVAGLTGTEQAIQDQLKNQVSQNTASGLSSSFLNANVELQKILGGKTEQQLLDSSAMKAAELLQSRQLEDANTSMLAANRRNIGAGGVGRMMQKNEQDKTINLATELGRQADLAQQAQMQALQLAPTYYNFEQFAPTQKLAAQESLAQVSRDVTNAQNQATYNQQTLQQEANIQDLLSKMGIATQYGEYGRQAQDKDTAAKLAMVQQYGTLPRQLEQQQATNDWQAQLQQLLFPYTTQTPILQGLTNQQQYAYQQPTQGSNPYSSLIGGVAGSALTGLFSPAAGNLNTAGYDKTITYTPQT